jgi:hypothetical protein
MMTLFASLRSSAVSGAVTETTSPAGCAAPPAAGAAVSPPKPPAMTLRKLRFIARHMMYERIAPDDPTSAPVTMRRSLESMKPGRGRAHPE